MVYVKTQKMKNLKYSLLVFVVFLSCTTKKEIDLKVHSIDFLLFNESCENVNPNPITFSNLGFNFSIENHSNSKLNYKILRNREDYLILRNIDTIDLEYFLIADTMARMIDFHNKKFEVDIEDHVQIHFECFSGLYSFHSMEKVIENLNVNECGKIYLNSLEINGKSGFVFELESYMKRRYFIDNQVTNNKATIKECEGLNILNQP